MMPRILNAPSPANIALIDNGCIPMLARMQSTGVCVNRDALWDLHKYFESEAARLTDAVEASSGYRINVGSPDQVADLLFKKLKVHLLLPRSRGLKLTTTGKEKVGKLELEAYLGVHEVVGQILNYRRVTKLDGSYALGFLAHARKCPDGAWRVFYTLKPCATDTGRLAGEDPNPMTAPQRTEEGRRIKACFIASPGCRLFECDFSQIEMRVAAHEAGASFMSSMFHAGADVHLQTAVRVYGLPPDQIDEMRHRYPMKRAGFLILYLGDAAALQIQLNAADAQDKNNPHAWTEEECAEVIDGWYRINPEIREWQDEQFARMYRTGMVWTMFGRVRLVPEMKSCHSWIRSKGKRQGANQPIQGGAADLFRIALKRLDDAYSVLRRSMRRVEALIPVHDAVLGEADEEFAEDVAILTRQEMEAVPALSVPIKADAKVGRRQADGWSELQKIKG
jgi:DNA polymerase I